MSQYCPSVQKSNVQRAFVMLENSTGVLEKPVAAGFVLPAGRGSIAQTPTYTDSPELSDTLDVVSQSRNAMPPGDWSLPMVARLAADAAAPQGDALFVAAMGKRDTSVSGERKYQLDTCRPTVSVWLQQDEVVQFMSGCVVESLKWSVERSGLTTFTFSGRGRKAGVVGIGELADAPSSATITLEAGQAMAFSVGGYVTNRTKGDGVEYQITAIDTASDTLVLDSAPSGWVAGEEIGPWLPETSPIGKEVENNSVVLALDGVEGKMRPSTFSASLPTQFLEEIGDEFPGESADNRRSVTMDMSVYFRRAEAVRFGQALEGKTMSVSFKASNENGSIEVAMPKVRLSFPSVGEDDAVLTLDSTGTALGVNGEDSFAITVKKAG